MGYIEKSMKNKVAIVTGGGSGIGRASCQLLALHGADLVVTDVNLSSAEETANQIRAEGGSAFAIQHDVSCEKDWEEVLSTVSTRYQQLDVLVNNAGMGLMGECKDITLTDWRRVLGVNLDGTFLGTKMAIRSMLEQDVSGSIINISSATGLVGGGIVSYDASKGGVTLLTKSVAAECGRLGYNIRVNSIHPGPINTPMDYADRTNKEEKQKAIDAICARTPMGRCGEPIEIAQGVLFLASDASSYMTGSALVIDGGYTAI